MTCPTCDGAGTIEYPVVGVPDLLEEDECPICDGTGEVEADGYYPFFDDDDGL